MAKAAPNALQSLVEAAGHDFDAVAVSVSREVARLMRAGQDGESAMKSAFAGAGVTSIYDEAYKTGILGAATQAAEIGLGGAFTTVDTLGLSNHILNREYKGVTLAASIHANAVEATKTTREAVRVAVNSKTTAARISKELQTKIKVSPQTSKQILEIAEAAKLRAAGRLDQKAEAMFVADLERARAYVDRLSLDDRTPTKYLRNAYTKLLNIAEGGDEAKIEAAIMAAHRAKTRYHFETIAISETTRAYDEGFMLQIIDDPDILGYRSVLSPDHPRPDICNVYSDADLFGLGAGGFPKGQNVAIGYHPRCLCMKEPIYKGNHDPKSMKYDPKAVEKYLESLPLHERQQIIGVKGSQDLAAWDQYLGKRGFVKPGPGNAVNIPKGTTAARKTAVPAGVSPSMIPAPKNPLPPKKPVVPAWMTEAADLDDELAMIDGLQSLPDVEAFLAARLGATNDPRWAASRFSLDPAVYGKVDLSRVLKSPISNNYMIPGDDPLATAKAIAQGVVRSNKAADALDIPRLRGICAYHPSSKLVIMAMGDGVLHVAETRSAKTLAMQQLKNSTDGYSARVTAYRKAKDPVLKASLKKELDFDLTIIDDVVGDIAEKRFGVFASRSYGYTGSARYNVTDSLSWNKSFFSSQKNIDDISAEIFDTFSSYTSDPIARQIIKERVEKSVLFMRSETDPYKFLPFIDSAMSDTYSQRIESALYHEFGHHIHQQYKFAGKVTYFSKPTIEEAAKKKSVGYYMGYVNEGRSMYPYDIESGPLGKKGAGPDEAVAEGVSQILAGATEQNLITDFFSRFPVGKTETVYSVLKKYSANYSRI